MNAQRLLQHFNRIAEAPDAVPRLRRFILDLAVRGKLVEQDPGDEPAAELLKRIRDDTDPVSFPSPDNWVSAKAASLLNFQYGKALPASDRSEQGRVRVFGSNGVVGYCEKALAEEPAIIVGRKGSAGALNLCDGPSWTTDVAYFLIPPAFFHIRFLFFALQTLDLGSLGKGVKPGLSRSEAYELPMAVPPLAEQQRIVAKVDELMALCDRLVAAQAERESRRDRVVAASLNRLNNGADAESFREHARFHLRHLSRLTTRPKDIQELRQTILNLAVRGKLVSQDPNDEHAAVLHIRLRSAVTRIQETERTRGRRDILPSGVGFFGDDAFPPSWVLTNFDSVNAIVSGVAKGKNLRGLKTAKYPYLRVANVQRGFLDLSVVKELEIRSDEIDRYRLRKGDVLMTEGGDWDKLGRAAIWNDAIQNCIHQNHIYRIRSANEEDLLPQWIMLFANSPLGRSYFEGASKQTTNLASINMTQLRSCPLPLPPIREQQRIVAKVDELMILCARLEAQVGNSAINIGQLLEAAAHASLWKGHRSASESDRETRSSPIAI